MVKAILKHGERIDGNAIIRLKIKRIYHQELNVEVEPLSAQKWQTLF